MSEQSPPTPESSDTMTWPPAPTGVDQGPEGPLGYKDLRAFPIQNGWLLFFLLLITNEFYAPFWLARTAKIINKITFKDALPLGYVWAYLTGLVLNILGVVVSGYMKVSGNPNVSSFDEVLLIFEICVGVYAMFLRLRFKGALNSILNETTPQLRNFSSLGTWILGPLYLQVALNNRIRTLSMAVTGRAVP